MVGPLGRGRGDKGGLCLPVVSSGILIFSPDRYSFGIV